MSGLQLTTSKLVRGEARQVATEGLTARLATDERTRNDAFAIRHASYVSGGYIDAIASGLFSDSDDEKPSSRCVVVYKWDRPVASVRLCTLDLAQDAQGWGEIPASRIFPEATGGLAAGVTSGKPAKLVELNRLVRHPDYANNFELVFILFRFVSFLVIEADADMMLSCVRRNHTSFYKRMHFEYVDGPRKYAGVKFETNLMMCPKQKYQQLMADIPFVETNDATKLAYAGLLNGQTVNVFYGA